MIEVRIEDGMDVVTNAARGTDEYQHRDRDHDRRDDGLAHNLEQRGAHEPGLIESQLDLDARRARWHGQNAASP
jgi:hypothetical protein